MTDDRDVDGEGSPREPGGEPISGPAGQVSGPPEPPRAPEWYGSPLPSRPDVPPYPLPDEPVARPRRSLLTIALATLVAVALLIGSGIGIGTYLTRSGRAASSTSTSASFADRNGVVDIDTFTTRTGMHTGQDFPLG